MTNNNKQRKSKLCKNFNGAWWHVITWVQVKWWTCSKYSTQLNQYHVPMLLLPMSTTVHGLYFLSCVLVFLSNDPVQKGQWQYIVIAHFVYRDCSRRTVVIISRTALRWVSKKTLVQCIQCTYRRTMAFRDVLQSCSKSKALSWTVYHAQAYLW